MTWVVLRQHAWISFQNVLFPRTVGVIDNGFGVKIKNFYLNRTIFTSTRMKAPMVRPAAIIAEPIVSLSSALSRTVSTVKVIFIPKTTIDETVSSGFIVEIFFPKGYRLELEGSYRLQTNIPALNKTIYRGTYLNLCNPSRSILQNFSDNNVLAQ